MLMSTYHCYVSVRVAVGGKVVKGEGNRVEGLASDDHLGLLLIEC